MTERKDSTECLLWADGPPELLTQNERKKMNDFLSFRYMITPSILKILCVLGMVVAFIAGIAMMIMADPISGIGVTILGPIVVRMYGEIMIVLFEIHGELKKMNDNGGNG